MIPIFDLAYSYYKNSRLSRLPDKPIEVIKQEKSDEAIKNICIIPTAVLSSLRLTTAILPKRGTNYIYPVQARYHITPDENETLKRIREVYKKAWYETSHNTRLEEINIVGISLGCVLATRLASDFECESLTLVVPGDRLGECALESRLTRPIVAKAESAEKYCEALREFDPIEHNDRINASRIEVYIGGKDLLIPAKRGKIIADALKQAHNQTTVREWSFADHFMTICLAAREISRGKR